ncbi:MAG TPA: putative sulfate exporter family transporter [Limnobacter sp.]|uniref:YeiH family protein n=1 Tax=Limnobacter sp. TaxID=2003368 RepID=UPI002ED9219D
MRVISQPLHNRYTLRGWMGALLCAALTAVAWVLAVPFKAQALGLGLLPLVMALGVVWANTGLPVPASNEQGLRWCKTIALRTGLALFGFQISLSEVLGQGVWGMASAMLMVLSTLATAQVLGRWLGLSPRQRLLVGMGSAICGAAAIAATESGWKGRSDETAAALATALVFGMLSMVALPWLAVNLHLSDAQAGAWIGLSIHEMGHVVAAALFVGGHSAPVAVLDKMMRVFLLAPTLVLVLRAAPFEGQKHAPVRVPAFLWGFVLAVLLNSMAWVPAWVLPWLNQLAQCALALGLAALGLSTRWDDLKLAGWKVWVLGAALCAQLWVFGLVLAHQCSAT